MKAAIVVEVGKTPIYGDFKEPVPAPGEVQVTVAPPRSAIWSKAGHPAPTIARRAGCLSWWGLTEWAALMMAAVCILRFRKRHSEAWRRGRSFGLRNVFRCRTIWMM